MISLALSRQLLGGHWPLVVPLSRYQLEETKVDGHSYAGTLDRLEKDVISGPVRTSHTLGNLLPKKHYKIQHRWVSPER